LEELKHSIEKTFASIDPETLCKVARYTLKWVDACLGGGEHFQHLL
jgi:hypothetical protein